MRTLLAAAATALSLTIAAPMAEADEDLTARLANTLDAFGDRYAFPGATAAIVLPDGRVVAAATGLADVENGRAMRPDTPMLAASIGKGAVRRIRTSLH